MIKGQRPSWRGRRTACKPAEHEAARSWQRTRRVNGVTTMVLASCFRDNADVEQAGGRGQLRRCFQAGLGELPVRVDDELARNAGVEGLCSPSGACSRLITLTLTILAMGSLSQSIACIRWRCISATASGRCERVGLCPAETEAQAEVAMFGRLLLSLRDSSVT